MRTPIASTLALLALLPGGSPARAQLLTAKEARVAVGHYHLNVTNIDAHKKFWEDTLGGQWVKLGFGADPSEGGTEDKVEVILKEGRWIPSAWVTDWPREMAALRARITTLADRKAREPRIVKDELASLDILLRGAAPAVDALLERVGVPRV